MGKEQHVFATEELTSSEGLGKPARFAEVVPECGESPTRTLQRHVSIQYSGTDIAYVGMLIQIVCQGVEAITQNLHVGINQADIVSHALTNPNVVRLGETEVLTASNQPDLRVTSFKHLR